MSCALANHISSLSRALRLFSVKGLNRYRYGGILLLMKEAIPEYWLARSVSESFSGIIVWFNIFSYSSSSSICKIIQVSCLEESF
ncbi:hypothetical protein BSAE_1821 [Bifidobacterium pullorum subsp. saeculare DSM 6531 = LMG 14934]|uniref:Uncharacterized protein n=1 Tax=Bifidobacterium pullorum subsp. saeculare DSM 6531 = LMG 14934 TaxID=1437611 RepID=A0A087CP31_9BIFI|nr:hypothetical protein BSAE_1821 [Bifidobacterium pullorum subsp. saeculare DSM 6531 = LMG 14934]